MQPEDFILKIVEAYQNARNSCCIDKRIRRGRSHSVSSISEDLFAFYLVENHPSINTIYVDQPITPASKKTFYPDLSIVRNDTIESFVDIKMDLGWNRNGFHTLCKKHALKVHELRGTKCRLRDGVTKEERILTLSNSLSYYIVVVARSNISPKALDEQLNQINDLAPSVEVFFLCNSGHPNTYSKKPEEVLKGLDINLLEFERLNIKLARRF